MKKKINQVALYSYEEINDIEHIYEEINRDNIMTDFLSEDINSKYMQKISSKIYNNLHIETDKLNDDIN